RALYLGSRLQVERDRANRLVYDVNMNLIQGEWDASRVTDAAEILAETENSPERGFEWFYWFRQCQLDMPELRSGYERFALSRNRKFLLTGGAATVRDARSLKLISAYPVESNNLGTPPNWVQSPISDDGGRIATLNSGKVQLWDKSGQELFSPPGIKGETVME